MNEGRDNLSHRSVSFACLLGEVTYLIGTPAAEASLDFPHQYGTVWKGKWYLGSSVFLAAFCGSHSPPHSCLKDLMQDKRHCSFL